jgi:hypothetical protein
MRGAGAVQGPAVVPELVTRHLAAMARWDTDANLRDVLDRRDLRACTPEVASALERRIGEERGPAPLLSLPYPKDDGTTRLTSVLDPFDDLWFCMLMSTTAPYVNRTLPGPTVVISTRFLPAGPGVYVAEDWRHAAKRKGQIVDRSGRSGVGGFDVASHYATTQFESVQRILNSCLVPPATIERVASLLRGFGDWPLCPQGLPIGPMGSAMLGTLALLPVDRLLRRLGVDHERWMDDFTIAAPNQSEFDGTTAEVEGQLGLLGQALNPSKTWFKSPLDSTESLVEVDLDDVQPRWDTSLEGLRLVVRMRDRKGCRYVLGGLRARERPDGVTYAAETDEVWELAPKHSGDYLVSQARALTEDDLEHLVNRCTAVPTETAAAGMAHSSRVLGATRVAARHGPRLHAAADQLATTRFRALSPGLYRAAAISRERPSVRHERSIDTAAALADLNAQRGLISGVRVDTPSKSIASALTALVRRHPDLGPTTTWVRRHQKL